MSLIKQKWKDRPLLDKIVSVLSIAVAAAIIALAVLQLCDVWSAAGYVYVPLMGVNLLLQAYVQWKPNRKVAIFSLCAAAVVFACAIAVYVLK